MKQKYCKYCEYCKCLIWSLGWGSHSRSKDHRHNIEVVKAEQRGYDRAIEIVSFPSTFDITKMWKTDAEAQAVTKYREMLKEELSKLKNV